ncbi:hypothetical protein E4U42_008051 [Claviceps africana]|uniref:EGF-like domain-containing protein n=1 Tax=Claviceps africana TaxID=83212 RepID=A0A8K0J328_9HYPO|nr:hypothetical protein E4U42_008051 [Claviceps africana]
MSSVYNGRDMDQSYSHPGSVKRAREQAQGMLYPESDSSRRAPSSAIAQPVETAPRSRPFQPQPNTKSNPTKGRATPNSESKLGQTISRPTQVPQWPLPGSSASSGDFDSRTRAQKRPQQTPQRPPRPSQSRIPSGLDQSKPSHPTPVFTAPPVDPDYLQDSTVDSYDVSSPSDVSAGQTTSSVGSVGTIPDIQAPAPIGISAATLRKNAALGPPPSSRRGASSFYSSASFVSPIAEETPRTRNQRLYAPSSTAMPGSLPGGGNRAHSPVYGEAFYEESLTEKGRESTGDDYGDESQLVQNASLVQTGKPALINTKPSGHGAAVNANHDTSRIQPTADNDPYLSAGTSSSETIPISRNPPRSHRQAANGEGISSDAFLKAFAAASSSDVQESIPLADAPRQHGRMSAMRRPPRLDIDAVRAAEARGSLTSLPDLIMRATRLAAMIDKGKRPASRLDVLDGWMNEKDDRHKSGFSDMLAAFPPPLHTPRNNTASRLSWFRNSSWPAAQGQDRRTHSRTPSGQIVAKPKRRCCGLPIWVFLLLVVLTLCLIAVAIVIPLEFFVFKNLGNSDKQEATSSQCGQTLTCLNGGKSLVSQGSCSCICTNGFTGSTCGDGGATGCAMTDLVSMDGQSSMQNVTLGRAIPRLIADANQNYSLPLSGTTILARFNAGNLSCMAQNALVTFDGLSTRTGGPADVVEDVSHKQANSVSNAEQFPTISSLSATPPTNPQGDGKKAAPATPMKGTSTEPPDLIPAIKPNSKDIDASSLPKADLPTTLVVDTSSTEAAKSDPVTSVFEVTQEKVDFARVAMLYILQEGSVDKAISAQGELQDLFSKASRSNKEHGITVSTAEASNVNLGSGYSINMMDFSVDVGNGPVGRKMIKSRHVAANTV